MVLWEGIVLITLTWLEVVQAATVGLMRRIKNQQLETPGANGIPAEAPVWDVDIEGACGELAAARALGLYWSGAAGVAKLPDVGGSVEVRTAAQGRLILRPDDPDDRRFVLVIGRVPTFDVCGWIYAGDGKRPEYAKAPNGRPPAWFVPRSRLRPITELRIGKRLAPLPDGWELT